MNELLQRLYGLIRPQDVQQAATSPITSPQLGMLNRVLGLSTGQAQTALQRMPEQLAQSQAMLESYTPGGRLDPRLMDQFMDLAGWGAAGIVKPMQAATKLINTKAVDESGLPKMVYHGTADPIEQFSKQQLGKATKSQSAKEGFFFLDNPNYARNYADFAAQDAKVKKLLDQATKAEKKGNWDLYDDYIRQAEELEMSFRKEYGSGQNIYPAYLDMKNPEVFDAGGKSYTEIEDTLTNIIKKAKKAGKDGVIFKNLDDVPGRTGTPADHYVVFEPGQVKSAISDPIWGLLD